MARRDLALGLVALVAIVAAVILGSTVVAGGRVAAFDESFTATMIRNSSPGWKRFFEGVSWMGSARQLAIAATIVGLVLIFQRRYVAAAWWLIAQAGAGALVLTIKAFVARSRPEFAYATEIERGWSFPSGHATRACVFAALAAYLVFRYARSRRTAVIVGVIAFVFAVMIAFSRVYLGAHFFTDSLGGLLIGAAWVAICAAGMEIGLRREAKRSSVPTIPAPPSA
jgi:undecaprenyl-diphosphatase